MTESEILKALTEGHTLKIGEGYYNLCVVSYNSYGQKSWIRDSYRPSLKYLADHPRFADAEIAENPPPMISIVG